MSSRSSASAPATPRCSRSKRATRSRRRRTSGCAPRATRPSPGCPPARATSRSTTSTSAGASFEQVYETIVARVLELAASGPTASCTPSRVTRCSARRPCARCCDRAGAAGIGVRVVAGVSFVDVLSSVAPASTRSTDGLLMLDALALGATPAPARAGAADAHRPGVRPARRIAGEAGAAGAYPPEHVRARRPRRRHAPRRAPSTSASRRSTTSGEFDHLTSIYVPPLPLTRGRPLVRGAARRHRAAALAGRRLPVGPGADARDAEALPARGGVRGARRARRRRAPPPGRGAGRPADADRAARAGRRGRRRVRDRGRVRRHHGEAHPAPSARLRRRRRSKGAADVLRNWETLKKEERPDAPLLDAVPKAMPALAQAQSRAVARREGGRWRREPPIALAHGRDALERLDRTPAVGGRSRRPALRDRLAGARARRRRGGGAAYWRSGASARTWRSIEARAGRATRRRPAAQRRRAAFACASTSGQPLLLVLLVRSPTRPARPSSSRSTRQRPRHAGAPIVHAARYRPADLISSYGTTIQRASPFRASNIRRRLVMCSTPRIWRLAVKQRRLRGALDLLARTAARPTAAARAWACA